ncbi:MAG: DUF4032 domain-containing protein [Propionibacteriaceae bacterium]|jgi:hypothetical protein|nr:DUF4032 domain-containing protein [Propionibacteriaceae bacterium]
MPHFLSAKPDSRFIPLPWQLPLAQWPADLLVALPRGISRHVVRFITVGGVFYAAKEVVEHLAMHEYRMLTDLRRLDAPSVEPVAVVTGRVDGRGDPLDPVLITKHLEFSLPYRTLFDHGVRPETVTRLVDALVVLFVRLHLIGFLWGDVSLSNVLFRRDAGEFAAYLVDAETSELHPSLSDGQREHDLSIAHLNLYGEFLDLEAGGILDKSLTPKVLADSIITRYRDLWGELTGAEEYAGGETYQVEDRVRRLNALGFDVAELDIDTAADGSTIRIQPKVVEAGYYSRRLMRLTGIDAEENQARRLLNDIGIFRAREGLQHLDEAVIGSMWLRECFQPVLEAVPSQLRGKRDPVQVYHEVLEHRWYLSERAQHEVPLLQAAQAYVHDILETLPDEQVSLDEPTVEVRLPANPYDPSAGFVDDEGPLPPDPWETGDDADLPPADFLDIAALRARQQG